ncbi:DnaJ C-terminal domain-containing protein [Actinomyces minihominis]|uniref:DnaJ C-terminal domain-containing protein n=1 Tax=Actinomyces minihominis TaxID=2002838 RepID=UPI000C0681C8|nr:DnaJ C-terminal domain-containing protein [Actinomyces minihominis]
MAEQDWLDQDFYKVLGVDKKADEKEIRKAYRKLARKWHPDQNAGDAKAEAKFKEIGEAFAVLSDKDQRERYDAIRAMGAGGAPFQGAGGGQAAGFEDLFGGMFGGGAPGGQYQGGGAGFGGAEDIFSSLFGGGNASFGGGSPFGGQRAAPRPQKGGDISTSTTLTFKQAYEGETLQFTMDGKSMKVRIPAGVRDGQKIRLRGKGQPGVAGGPAGDLVVQVAVEKSAAFTMDGANLRVKVPVSYPEAALGARIDVPLPDGTKVGVKVPANTSSGRVLRVRERGVKRASKRGDVLVELQITTPAELSEGAKASIEALAAELGNWDPREALKVAAAK